MKNIRNRTVFMLALVLTMLAGCGGNNSAETTASTAPPTVETAAPETVQPAPAAETAAPETIVPAPPTVETTASEPVLPPAPTETVPEQTSGQTQEPASERFTGVMGTEFSIPEGFIQLDESPSIGYQYTFWHPDHEIRIVVYEIAPGYIPEGAYDTDYNIAKNNPDVTYFNEGESWFVQSGYNNNGEEIFYSKESSTDSGLKTLWITYPTDKREFGDLITAEFEKNLHF